MFGIGGMTVEMLNQWYARMAERDRRAAALQATGMLLGEAYMRVTCEMEHEEWVAREQAKLADIRENGT